MLRAEFLADRLLGAFTDEGQDQLAQIATYGETYGHHQKNADMALACCIEHIRSNDLARLTVYAEYLEQHPPAFEVEIHENSSWSCVHGVERWKNDCGCNSGMHAGRDQSWRAPLRGALDWLRDSVYDIYEREMKQYNDDPWGLRDKYIYLVIDRSPDLVLRVLSSAY